MTEEIKKTRELQGGIRKRGYKCSGSDTVILSMIDKRKLFEGDEFRISSFPISD